MFFQKGGKKSACQKKKSEQKSEDCQSKVHKKNKNRWGIFRDIREGNLNYMITEKLNTFITHIQGFYSGIRILGIRIAFLYLSNKK